MLIKKIFIKTLNQLIYQLNIENLKFIKNNLAFKIRTALNYPEFFVLYYYFLHKIYNL